MSLTRALVVQRQIAIGSPFLPLSISTAQLGIPDSRIFDVNDNVYYLGPRAIILNNRLSITRWEWALAHGSSHFSSATKQYLVRYRTPTGTLMVVVSEGVDAPDATVVLQLTHVPGSLVSISHSPIKGVIGILVDYLPVATVNLITKTGTITYDFEGY